MHFTDDNIKAIGLHTIIFDAVDVLVMDTALVGLRNTVQ